MVSKLSHVLKIVAERVKDAPELLEFELFFSHVYIGLFANERSESFLKAITADFAEEMQKVGESRYFLSCWFFEEFNHFQTA